MTMWPGPCKHSVNICSVNRFQKKKKKSLGVALRRGWGGWFKGSRGSCQWTGAGSCLSRPTPLGCQEGKSDLMFQRLPWELSGQHSGGRGWRIRSSRPARPCLQTTEELRWRIKAWCVNRSFLAQWHQGLKTLQTWDSGFPVPLDAQSPVSVFHLPTVIYLDFLIAWASGKAWK
jgi:hypothetical protein